MCAAPLRGLDHQRRPAGGASRLGRQHRRRGRHPGRAGRGVRPRALRGPRRHPYGKLFATLVAPRLGPVTEREPAQPLRFAQFIGLLFAIAGVTGFAFGAPLIGVIAAAFALTAAFLNAAFGICLGCQVYPWSPTSDCSADFIPSRPRPRRDGRS